MESQLNKLKEEYWLESTLLTAFKTSIKSPELYLYGILWQKMGLFLASEYDDTVDNGDKTDLFISLKFNWVVFLNEDSKLVSNGT